MRQCACSPRASNDLETTKSTDMHREDRTFAGVRVVREVSANMDDVVAKLRARMGRLTIAAVIDIAQKQDRRTISSPTLDNSFPKAVS